MRLYRASDMLMKHRSKIEDCLFNRTPEPFDPDSTVILYDCANNYIEGSVGIIYLTEIRSETIGVETEM